jgi:hypothetical protein
MHTVTLLGLEPSNRYYVSLPDARTESGHGIQDTEKEETIKQDHQVPDHRNNQHRVKWSRNLAGMQGNASVSHTVGGSWEIGTQYEIRVVMNNRQHRSKHSMAESSCRNVGYLGPDQMSDEESNDRYCCSESKKSTMRHPDAWETEMGIPSIIEQGRDNIACTVDESSWRKAGYSVIDHPNDRKHCLEVALIEKRALKLIDVEERDTVSEE